MSSPLVEVHPDPQALASVVAGELIERLRDVQSRGEVPAVVLTGGTIADAVHREIAGRADADEVDWTRVDLWWGDERFVGPEDHERNALQARRAFLDAVDVDPERVHEIPSTADVEDLGEAVASYEEALSSRGGRPFDVVMLGMGPDGHVASLFPGHPALAVDDRAAVAVPNSPKPPAARVSMTLPTLRAARSVWFLVSGEAKAEAVERALAGGAEAATVDEIPAVGVEGEETVWFLDRAAAALL
ncbi:6-phosphogluconolactonase [Nocardioides sp.]|uniref:6-phosphogluconolactonase n=1 Tax=Nocardioides sp. TaxID=35761 RepID=UPI003568A0E6